MKIRNGFVSNSSSSSFVVITTRQSLDNIIEQSDSEMKEFIEAEITNRGYSFCHSVKIHGADYIDLSRVLHDCSPFDYWDDDSQNSNGGYKTSGGELWKELLEKIKASGGYVNEEVC